MYRLVSRSRRTLPNPRNFQMSQFEIFETPEGRADVNCVSAGAAAANGRAGRFVLWEPC